MSEASSTLSFAQAVQASDVLFDRESLQRAVAEVGARVDVALDGERALFLTIMHGGLIFAGQLALSMRTDVEFDYVHATRYRGDTRGHELQWLRKPEAEMQGRTVLLVDDILDEGRTLKAVREACLAMGARRVLIVTLCTKLHDRRVPDLEADFNGVEVPDRYVFGFGMDYHEQGRNLPEIRALRSVS
ncbi:hypoxanthine-guanine phosphoribosyltransferase [Oleiagrimonas soli]|uniref:Hypoxanthine phosphoribosyltransferase n=1 Tax=Oleiagrimonas soli TaxID=1543381 RepID=A0A099CV11_9GAMM|nr:hypoxanthine-guanine phosphoribosyltransferase [Oleiagrimonas soli]KGI77452.1 hypoxanthine-guanine phosphoribosyltransferase [Oleiagrimonas soli]MBB6183102.1 hypoxanthine phosphoribosyltransferase [Oleiagrimonas soli]